MNDSYDKLLQNLNAARWELKNHNDSSLNRCMKYITDAIFEAGRLNARCTNLSAEYDMFKFMHSLACTDDADDWSED